MRLLMTVLQLVVVVCNGRVQWSYSDYGPHSQQLLSYKNKVQIQTVENTSVQFSSCTSVGYDRPQYTLLCPRPGFHQADLHSWPSNNQSETNRTVSPVSNRWDLPISPNVQPLIFDSIPKFNFKGVHKAQNSTIYFPLDNTPFCYSWIADSQYFQVNSTLSQVVLRVWIQAESSDEGDSLSAQFHSLGESPSLTVTTPDVLITSTSQGFSSSCSCWTFILQAGGLPYEFGVGITGKGVVIFDCGVRPTKVLISRAKLINSALVLNSGTSLDSPAHQDLLLYQDPGVTGIVVLLHGGTSFITQDDFQTIHNFQVPGLPAPVDKVAMTDSSLLLLVNGSLYTLPTEQDGPPQLTGDSMVHVTARSMESVHTVVQETSGETVVAWNDAELGFQLSTNGGESFRDVVLQPGASQVHSVVVHPSLPEVEALISSSNSTAHFRRYDISSGTWSEEGFSFNYNGGRLSSQFFPSAFGELVVWEDTALYHSPNRGLTVSQLPIYTTPSDSNTLTPHQWESGDSIKQVALGPGGQFAVLSSTNSLFYGTSSVGYGIEIASGVSTTSGAAVVFNAIGELKIASAHNDSLIVRKVPTYSLVLSALYPPPACPYLQWQHNLNQAVYYLDSRGQVDLWASLTPAQWEDNQISVLTSDPSSVILSISHQLIQTALEGSVQRNMTLSIRPSPPESISSSRTAIKISASSQNLACQDSAEAVSLFSVQCPPTRHIRVKRPTSQSTNCPSYSNFSYTVRRGQYDPDLRGRTHVPGNIDMEVTYDVSRFGCPFKLPYTNTFKPVLELYDGDTLLEEVEVDFVVWELNGRTDFGYTATANRVRCLSAPQNWQDLLENGTHPSVAWTPQTYRSCFESDGDLLVRRAPYQILNKTGGSSLTWRGYNGIYLMAAQVVAPGYSYCDLRAYFAVEVYGAVNYSYIGYILLVLTCLVGLFALVTAYFCYRNMLRAGIKKVEKND